MGKEKEIDMIYNVIRKTPSISNQLFSIKLILLITFFFYKNHCILFYH